MGRSLSIPQLEPTYLSPQEAQRGGWLIVRVEPGGISEPPGGPSVADPSAGSLVRLGGE